jgi:3-demethoxyubiquinol 3-hydroxylase
MPVTKFSFVDKIIMTIDNGIRAVLTEPIPQRVNPAKLENEALLTKSERTKSAALMRVNHTGEVCAQALYLGQALVAKSSFTRTALYQAAEEETDHLAWCQERIQELGGHTSYLNPLWYVGSFGIGLLAGILEDKWSLGFVVETENQVEKHLKKHLQDLPFQDRKSKRIVEEMSKDEAHHAITAKRAGGSDLPYFIKRMMALSAKVMTTTTYYI